MAGRTLPQQFVTANRLVFVSVVPSPYQRDVFRQLAARGSLPMVVYYLEQTPHDTPWPAPVLESWEHILPGRTIVWTTGRSHLNWQLPLPQAGEFWILNTAMTDVTSQLLMRRLGSRTPWAFWGELPSIPRTAFRRWLQRRQYAPLGRARFLAAIGSRAEQAYRQLCPGVPVYNRPYACDLSAFTSAAAAADRRREFTFLFCGQMIARKGIDLLIEAFAHLVASEIPVRLRLVGREAELPAIMAGLNPATRSRIEYLGFQSPDSLPAEFARADAFVLPSRHDGWGVVVNQAIGAGLPVIVSNQAGAAELVRDGENGFIVPVADATALTGAMRRLATESTLRDRMAAKARALASTIGPDAAAEFWERAVTSQSRP